MTAIDRLARELPRLLEELYLGPMPSYRDDVVRRVAATPQRPGWILPGRWFDVTVFSGPVATPRLPWRTIAVLALLVLALLAAARLVGSQERRLPDPFGPAGNRLIAYAHAKDIYVGDPTTGTTTAIVTGPEEDTRPAFSPDGSRIAFLRRHSLADSLCVSDIVTVRPDGSQLRVITSGGTFYDFAWTADSASLVTEDHLGRRVAFDAAGGTEPVILGNDFLQSPFSLREPNGDRWLSVDDTGGWADLAVMNGDGSVATVLVDRSDGFFELWSPVWSPDASRVAFIAAVTSTPCKPSPYGCDDARLHVVNTDGSGLRQISRSNAGAGSDNVVSVDHPVWSSDGTWIAFGLRTFWDPRTAIGTDQLIVVEVDTGAEREIEVGDDFSYDFRREVEWSSWSWSPDGRSLLVRVHSRSLFTADPRTGRTQTLPWEAQDAPSWQRLADD